MLLQNFISSLPLGALCPRAPTFLARVWEVGCGALLGSSEESRPFPCPYSSHPGRFFTTVAAALPALSEQVFVHALSQVY